MTAALFCEVVVLKLRTAQVNARIQRKFDADKAGEKFATNDILDRFILVY